MRTEAAVRRYWQDVAQQKEEAWSRQEFCAQLQELERQAVATR